MTNSKALLAKFDAAFGAISKPEHFTDYTHCSECAQHDELLRTRDRDTLQIEDVGNRGWDPLCFSSDEGIAYYMPALLRLTLATETLWYRDQLLFHLSEGAATESFRRFCNAQQRQAVAGLLAYFIESRSNLGDSCAEEENLVRLHERWSDGA